MSSIQPYDSHQSPAVPVNIPPLAPGDRLTRDEFERRWQAMPALKNAELIEGVVHMAAAVRYQQHGNPESLLNGLLFVYAANTPGVEVAGNTSVRLDLDNMPQPDAMLRIRSEIGGQSKVDEEGYLEGAPELVAEVAASTASYDLHDKLNVYRKHGVREYVVWRVLEQSVDWFVLREGRFDSTESPADGVYQSQHFPGLWIATKALIAGDGKQLLDTLQAGLATAEHTRFVEELRQRGQSPS